MTRKKEIDKEANSFANTVSKGEMETVKNWTAFTLGAEWADKTMLDRVCDYLKKLVYQEYPGGPLVRRIDDEELKNLRKAIEE